MKTWKETLYLLTQLIFLAVPFWMIFTALAYLL